MDNTQGTTTPKTKDNSHGNINGKCRIDAAIGNTKISDDRYDAGVEPLFA
jgi:hypothetical protein